MNEVTLLLKKDLMQIFSFALNIKETTKDKDMSKKLFMYIIIALSMVFGTYSIFIAVSSMYDAFASSGQEAVFFFLSILGYSIMIIISVMPYSISKLYYAKDTESLLCLPIESKSILLAKTIMMAVSFPFFIVIVMLPGMIKYGNGILYYIFNIVNLVAYAFIISSIFVLISIVLMLWISKFPRAKNVLQIISMIVMIILILLIQFITKDAMVGASPSVITEPALRFHEGLKSISTYFPPIGILTTGLSSTCDICTIRNSLLNVVIAILSVNLASYLGFKMWLKGLSRTKSSPKVKVNKKALGSSKTYKTKSPVFSLALKELTCVYKIPIYLFNIGLIGIIMPIALAVPIAMEGELDKAPEVAAKLGEFISQLPISIPNFIGASLVIGIALGAFASISGSSASSSISREGKNIWIMQTLPIDERQQILGRLLASVIISIISVLPIIILVTVFVKPPIYLVLFVLLGSAISSALIATYSLYIDILRPKLSWNSPQGAVKQNLNIVFTMFIDVAYAGGMGYIIFKLFEGGTLNTENMYLTAIGVVAAHIVLEVLFYKLCVEAIKKKITRYNT